jgi:hypothetical protein
VAHFWGGKGSLIGGDAHKKFSMFVAVNEKDMPGEALRAAHDRELYREFLSRLPAHSVTAVEATGQRVHNYRNFVLWNCLHDMRGSN